ncbi:hypothetical protein ACIA8F_23665 [Streptomyces sp. NPDC051563]|uniref:hypothetical protein n=1 Tax=Streptomyces sp. NPDC051563 TaxID=3365659 RepID=UPI0037A1E982
MTWAPDHHLAEITVHPLIGREVAHLATGRKGTVGLVLEHRSKIGNRLIRTVAHMRPLDASGREWTAEVEELQPIRPIAPDMPAGYR